MVTLEELYHQSLEALPAILRVLGREKRLSPEELEDLRSDIQVKLLEDDYRVLRRWDSRASLKGYLAIVLYNIWHDRVRGEKGKVVVSAAARRLGPPAPELEVLLGRQGLTFEEAYQAIKPRFPGLSRGEAEEIATQINPRPSRSFESVTGVTPLPDPEPTAEERLEQREKLGKKRKALALMDRLLSELPEQDCVLLVRAHAEGVKFSRISRSLGLDQRSLYRHNERLLTKLRTDLEEAGIRWEDLSEVLGIDAYPSETGPEERAGAGVARRRLFEDEALLLIEPREIPGRARFRIMARKKWMAEIKTCVTPTDLAAFLEGSLKGEERDRMVWHLIYCPDCFERYIGAARLLDAIEEEEASAALSAADGN